MGNRVPLIFHRGCAGMGAGKRAELELSSNTARTSSPSRASLGPQTSEENEGGYSSNFEMMSKHVRTFNPIE
jgi:hypothetical protein